MKKKKSIVYDQKMFIKFVDEKYYQNFINKGELFFGNLSLYRNIEENNGNRGIGDRDEGNLNFTKGELKNYGIVLQVGDQYITYKDIHANKNDLATTISPQAAIFCCTILSAKHNLINSKRRNRFINNIKDSLLSDNNYNKKVVLIPDFNGFINKFNVAAKKYKMKTMSGPVIYDNNHYEASSRLVNKLQAKGKNLDLTHSLIYVKREEFKHQQEFRMTIDTPDNNSFKLYLGPLKNDTITFDSIEECLNSINIETKIEKI
ncbi:hypothetical protein DY102_07190 [Apilactobacillus timberlakei]|uniref:hypothetical protein n=1 Tax=Apilactobacillus timberlakei TaxID=2008380 RepID=UPI00112CE8FB|nr:hypothetical protein [Apilactobacillus timberlakei]TPR21468.1 hypothetical protein DY102_07190 [Apilactobacillus timberlakei]